MITQKFKGWQRLSALLLMLAWLIVGCNRTLEMRPVAVPSATVALPGYLVLPINDAIPQMLIAERTAAIEGDLPLLETLWATDARVVDGRDTPEEIDDYSWQGRPALLDRYRVAVFPNPPPPLLLSEPLRIRSWDDDAGEIAYLTYGNDKWTFIYKEDRWWLFELIYSQP